MANQLTPDQLNKFKDVFSTFGCIKTNTIAAAMRSIGEYPTKGELQQMINEVDPDGSGEIDFSDFLTMMARKSREEKLRSAFRTFDRDGDGFISANDLRRVINDLGGEDVTVAEAEQMIREVDTDGDGLITLEDFMATMTSKLSA